MCNVAPRKRSDIEEKTVLIHKIKKSFDNIIHTLKDDISEILGRTNPPLSFDKQLTA
jgi:hypothetical protein